jgi:hypothetical protein
MNGIAINADGDFFNHARSDPALLHSVLHLVALYLDLNSGKPESQESLYHGSEAFQIINQRLRTSETFSNMTIASVAMLANKEVSPYPPSYPQHQHFQKLIDSRTSTANTTFPNSTFQAST